MPYELIWEPEGVIRRFTGNPDTRELLQAGNDTRTDVRSKGYRYVINDFLGCTDYTITKTSVDEVIAIDRAAAPRLKSRIRIAILGVAPSIIAATDWYIKSPMNIYPVRIFSTLADARAWLATPVQE